MLQGLQLTSSHYRHCGMGGWNFITEASASCLQMSSSLSLTVAARDQTAHQLCSGSASHCAPTGGNVTWRWGQAEGVVACENRNLMARQQSHITSLTTAARKWEGET